MNADDRLLVPCGDGPHDWGRARGRCRERQFDRREMWRRRPLRRVLAGVGAPHRGPCFAPPIGRHTRRL